MTEVTQNPQKPVEPGKEERAQLKKLMDSHMLILEHRLGRPPQMTELLDFLKEGQDVALAHTPDPAQTIQGGHVPDTGEAPVPMDHGTDPMAMVQKMNQPKILDMKVVYGMAGEGAERKADPNKILFYRTPDNRWYDTHSQSWLASEPPHGSHLPSRDLNFNDPDLCAAMAHGVLDEDDFQALDKSGMIKTDGLPRQIWTQMSRLRSLNTQLEKSESEESTESEEEVESEIDDSEDTPETTEGAPESQKDPEDSAPEESEPDSEETLDVPEQEGTESTEGDLKGEDVFAQIMEAAMSYATDEIEGKIANVIERILRQHGLIDLAKEEADEPEHADIADELEEGNDEPEKELTNEDEKE